MAVAVLIRREVVAGKGKLLENLYRELVELAVRRKGYLSAETMRRAYQERIDDFDRSENQV